MVRRRGVLVRAPEDRPRLLVPDGFELPARRLKSYSRAFALAVVQDPPLRRCFWRFAGFEFSTKRADVAFGELPKFGRAVFCCDNDELTFVRADGTELRWTNAP